MYIKSIGLRQFRSYNRLELDLPAAPILLIGANAQGKTSLLEAMAYLALGQSPLTSVDQRVIRWDAVESQLPFAYIKGEIARRSQTESIEIALEKQLMSNGRARMQKRIRIDQRAIRRADLAGHLNVVIFLPEDMQLVTGSPEGRRSHLDALLSQVYPDYVKALSIYKRTVSRRNALLKHLREHGGDQRQLRPLEDRLVQTGVFISVSRQKVVTELTRYADQLHEELTGGDAWLELNYQPNFDTLSPDMAADAGAALHDLASGDEDLHDAYRRILDQRRRTEIQRGVTLVGPHRDELRFLSNGIDMGDYGSRGQQRTVVLALRLAALRWLEHITGESPVLLLDEVLAELDHSRRQYLLNTIKGVEQTILATTDAELFPDEFRKHTLTLEVRNGIVNKLSTE